MTDDATADAYRTLAARGLDFVMDRGGSPLGPPGGFAVAVGPRLRSIEEAVALAGPGDLFGHWVDPATGVAHVDLVALYAERATAVVAALAGRRLALYDFAARRVVPTHEFFETRNRDEEGTTAQAAPPEGRPRPRPQGQVQAADQAGR